MKSEIWDEKKAQKAKTIVQYLIDNVKNVSVFKSFHSSTNQKPIFLPISHDKLFLHPYLGSHLSYPTWFLHPSNTYKLVEIAHVKEMTIHHNLWAIAYDP